jgi:hypothetical protein
MTQETPARFTRTIQEDSEGSGELVIDLGNEICDMLGWQVGDVIEWIDNKDGTWILQKKNTNN